MRKAVAIVCLCLTLGVSAFARKGSNKAAAGVDAAYMQKIWDGWATLNPDNTAEYYAKGPHVFFDIAPLKYNSWDEYYAGVKNVLSGFKSAKLTVQDPQIHPAGEYVWTTATVDSDMIEQSGKEEKGAFRWTAVFHKEGGKWLIVHEHVSSPLP